MDMEDLIKCTLEEDADDGVVVEKIAEKIARGRSGVSRPSGLKRYGTTSVNGGCWALDAVGWVLDSVELDVGECMILCIFLWGYKFFDVVWRERSPVMIYYLFFSPSLCCYEH